MFSVGRKKGSDVFSTDTWVKMDLEKQATYDGADVPLIVTLTIETVERRGLDCPDIYRISGPTSLVKQLRTELITSKPSAIDDSQYADINIMTSVLKQYLQDIPKPVVNSESFTEFHASLSESPFFLLLRGVFPAATTTTSISL